METGRIITISGLTLAIGILIGCATYKSESIFYDGEGNEIPVEVVQLQVKSRFVHLNA